MFHPKCGLMVILSNRNRTATRSSPTQEFDNAVVFSSEPLLDNQLFEVRIDKRLCSWSGSIEIGVTPIDISNLELPECASDLRGGTWLMSGNAVLYNGNNAIDVYGTDLNKLRVGHTVGVMRSAQGDLLFFVNGVSQGVAARNLPKRVFAVLDLYGKCVQITAIDSATVLDERIISNRMLNESVAASESTAVAPISLQDRLRFSEKAGPLVKLTNNNCTAERRAPFDEFNNGVVMTHRPLRDNEVFEIRIDRLVDKWSGSIEVGISTHDPSQLEFPSTMTNLRSGTTMMSGSGILTNGKGTRTEYGDFNLDDLKEGDRIGMVRKSNGDLHYFINSQDQGVAASRVPERVWGVVDLYGMTVKVTILHHRDAIEDLLESREVVETVPTLEDSSLENPNEQLTFHPTCGNHAAVINGGRTAHRPSAMEDFNNGVVLTTRPLRPNEIFEVRLDKVVTKWAGSIEIGLTTHAPTDLDFPSTMTNVRSGTWMMTGNGVMHNGTTILHDYGTNLDRLSLNDRVGVQRNENGNVHFFVNGRDQGWAASNVPEWVYGVIDLYGQAAQATIVDDTQESCEPVIELPSIPTTTLYSDLRFHHLHGRNARVSNNGLTASRPNAQGEFNYAIVISNRPLRDGEMFEVIIERMVDRWSGSIEAGVTAIRPEDLDFPSTMTDIEYDTWMLSGCAIMQDGRTLYNGYRCDLDQLQVSMRLGMVRNADGTLQYSLNGELCEVAFRSVPENVYAVIDLYGQCAQVSIVPPTSNNENSQNCPLEALQLSLPVGTEVIHRYYDFPRVQRFSGWCGKNVALENSNTTAERLRNFKHGLVLSAQPLQTDELFEVRIDEQKTEWSGSLHIGVAAIDMSDTPRTSIVPATMANVEEDTWYIAGTSVWHNGSVLSVNYCSNLDRLGPGDCVGVKRMADGSLHGFLNGEDLGAAAYNIPKKVSAIIDLFGSTDCVTITSTYKTLPSPSPSQRNNSFNFAHASQEGSVSTPMELCFHENHGRNVQLGEANLSARRTESYNQGVVLTNKPIPRGHLFQVRILKMNSRWSSSLMIGVVGVSPSHMTIPTTALQLKKNSWLICGDCVFHNDHKLRWRYGPNLDSLKPQHLVGILVDMENRLHLYVNGVDQGIAAKEIPTTVYGVIDLYGQAEQVHIVESNASLTESLEAEYLCREKGDIETDGEEREEKRTPKAPLETSVLKNCPYQLACIRFKNSLGLPSGYFTGTDKVICYCEPCHKLRGDELFYRKGEPPQHFAIPKGWCKFPIRLSNRIDNSSALDEWHVAYHGTRLPAIRRILDTGEILPPDELGLERQLRGKGKSKEEEGEDCSPLILSPTLKYAGLKNFTSSLRVVDSETGLVLEARVALQVLVEPGSYKVGAPSGGTEVGDVSAPFNLESLEWNTKERGNTLASALLLKLDGL